MEQADDKKVDNVLREIVAGTAAVIGEEFFRELVRRLARALGVKWAFVAEFAGSPSRVRTLAFWTPEGFMEPIEYDLLHTPCQDVLAGHTRLYTQNVAALFPRDPGLAEQPPCS